MLGYTQHKVYKQQHCMYTKQNMMKLNNFLEQYYFQMRNKSTLSDLFGV